MLAWFNPLLKCYVLSTSAWFNPLLKCYVSSTFSKTIGTNEKGSKLKMQKTYNYALFI